MTELEQLTQAREEAELELQAARMEHESLQRRLQIVQTQIDNLLAQKSSLEMEAFSADNNVFYMQVNLDQALELESKALQKEQEDNGQT